MEAVQNIRRTIGTILFLLSGPLLWALHFTLTYGPQSAICAYSGSGTADGQGPVTALIGVMTILAILLAGGALVFSSAFYRALCGTSAPGDQWPFLQGVMRALTGLSILAIVYASAAVLFMPACASLR